MILPLQDLLITVNVVSSKKCVLVIHKILRLFVNILTDDDKSDLFNRDKLAQLIQMKLYQKQKSFCEFFFCIFKIYIKF